MFMYWKKLNIVSYCRKGFYVYIINPNITYYDVYIIKYHCLHYVYIVKLQRHSAFSSKLPGKAPRWHSTLRGAQGKPSGRRGSKLPWHRIITAVPQGGLVGVGGMSRMSKFVWWCVSKVLLPLLSVSHDTFKRVSKWRSQWVLHWDTTDIEISTCIDLHEFTERPNVLLLSSLELPWATEMPTHGHGRSQSPHRFTKKITLSASISFMQHL